MPLLLLLSGSTNWLGEKKLRKGWTKPAVGKNCCSVCQGKVAADLLAGVICPLLPELCKLASHKAPRMEHRLTYRLKFLTPSPTSRETPAAAKASQGRTGFQGRGRGCGLALHRPRLWLWLFPTVEAQ